eukprot:5568479-Pyramimonas_sp.AAC.1
MPDDFQMPEACVKLLQTCKKEHVTVRVSIAVASTKLLERASGLLPPRRDGMPPVRSRRATDL